MCERELCYSDRFLEVHDSTPSTISHKPVGTNLVLVRQVRAKDLLSMKAERAKRAECLAAWGPGAR